MNLFFTFLSPFLSFNDYKLFVMDPIIRIPDIINPRGIFRVVILGFLLSVMGAGISYGQSAPEVSGIPDQSIMEGSSFATINLDDYVTDADNLDTELTWIATGNTDLSVTITDRVATITPLSGEWNGSETITFTATDPGSLSGSDAATFSVTSVNDLPIASDDSFGTSEDTPLSGSVSGNDTPSGDGGNVWSLVTQALHGVAVVNTDGTYTYTPALDYNGSDSFTYQLCDTDADCSTGTVIVTITSVNDTPSATDDTNTTTEDTQVGGNVSTNDTPSGDGGNIWSLVGANGGAAHGTVTMNPDGSYTYTPAANYNGTDVFTYQLCDADADCSTGTVTVTITSVNDTPSATDDTNTTTEDTQVGGNVSTNDTPSGDGGNLWSLVGANGGASHGTVTMNPDGSYTYTPAANYNGTDVFTYQLCDTDADCSTGTVTVTITSVDDTPSSANDTNTTTEDTQVSGNVSTNDTPSGDGGNVWSLVGANGGAAHGTVTMNPDGSYTYTPAANYNGTDVFTYQLCDADADCTTATVTITITAVDDTPSATNDTNTTTEDTQVSGNVSTNDTPSGDGGNVWSLVGANGGAAHGTVTMNPDGSYTYTPAANYNGTDVFTYQLCDADADCTTATVTITITAVDDTPSATNDTNTTTEDTQVSGNVSTNDTPSGDGGNVWSLVGANGGAAHGTVTMNPDGSYTYTPAANYNGTDVFTYQLCDADADCTTATVTITITTVDDLPVAADDSFGTAEDTPLGGTVAGNDIPSGDGGNVWSLVTQALHGIAVVNADGTYTYTPVLDYNGPDTFSYQICDIDGDCDQAVVSITVSLTDDVPVAVDDSFTTDEDIQISSTLSGNDTPSGDGGNVWSLVTQSLHGTAVVNTNGTFTYTPAANYNGTDTFTYRLCDTDSDCDEATVTITITAVDDTPSSANDTNTTTEDTQVSGNVSTNDTPSGDGGNIWSLVGANGGAAHGTVTMNPDGSYTYTPAANYNGTDVFTYQLCDADADCTTATVTITITTVDDLPVAADDSFGTAEDTPLGGTVAGNDTPSGDGGNIWSLVGANGGAAHGTVTMNPDGSYTYTPAANYNGTDVFTYQLCDADADCTTATVTITITAVDDAPVAADDSFGTAEDTPLGGTVAGNDTPSGDGGNVWSLVTQALHGAAVVNGDGSFTYTPATNYNGTDTFTYQLCDTDADCSTGTVTVTITSVNDTPSATDDTNTTTEDTQVGGNVSTNDTPSGDGGNLWSLVGANGGASHGTVTMNPDGSYTYTPEANYNGTDVFTYQLCDTDADCSTGTVTVTITAVDDLPIASDDSFGTSEDTPLGGSVAGNDTPSGDGGNVWSLVTQALHGAAVVNGDGSFTYTPATNYNGTDTFTYQLCDADADCTTATVTITITAVDDTPSSANDTNTTTEDTQVSGNVSINDTPSGDGGNVWSLVGANGGAAHGTVTMNPDGSYTYTPAANYNGTDVFTYQLCDADADCTTATVTITITAVDDTPSATNDTNTTTEDTQVSGNVSTNDTPSGDGGNVWSLVGANGGAAHGTVTMNPDGSYTYTPAANYNGTDVFTYQLCDADADCTTATVTITITAVDDTPSSANDTNTTAEDTQVSGNVSTNDTPSGDGGNVWSLVGANGGAAHGTVTMNPDGSYTYTPAANYNGTDVFTYQLCDADADCTTATVTITITAVDDAPVAADDSFGTAEDTPLGGSVAGNDTPSGDGGNVWSLVTQALHGIAVVNADGTYTYTPVLDYNGPDTFSYQICDIDGDCDQAVVSITVSLTDDVPVAVDDSFTTDEDIQISSTLSGNDTPSGDGGNVWSLVTQALHGIAVVNADGTYTYTPVLDYNGPDTFSYQICDIDGDCDQAVVSITVSLTDDVPVAVDDSFTTDEDIQISSTLSGNDTPSGDGGNVWSLVTQSLHGTAVVNTNGTFTYTPAANYNGTDTFTYRLCDTDSDCDEATVTITITAVDDTPSSANDTNTTTEDTQVSGNVSTNDTPSGDGGNLWSLVGANGGAAHGTVTMNPDGSYTYTPAANYNGTDVFTYQLCDADADCTTATVTITITAVDDTPSATNDTNTTTEDTQVSGNVSTNDTPSGDGGNVWSLVGANGGAAHGTVTMNPDGSYTYTPAANYNGTDVFTYQLCDADADCTTATVTITITAVDDTPSATNDTNTTTEDTQVSGNVSTNDTPSGDGGNVWSLVGANGGAAHGTVTMNPDGSYTYTPAANYNGTDVFTYQLCDADADCTTATVTITITAVDDTPSSTNDTNTTAEDTQVSGSVSTNDTPSGDGGNVWSLVGANGGAAHGTVTMNPDGSYTYTPAANYNGTDVFTYQLCDADADCTTATVTITITAVDDTPSATNDTNTTTEDTQVSGNVSTNDTPSGDGGNVWSLVGANGGAAHGTVTMNPDGSYTYTPAANYNGTDVFTYQLCDADADCTTATVTITITAVDDTPSATNDTNTTTEDTQVSGNVSTNDTPSGDGGNVWSLVGANGGAAHGTVTMNPDGSYTYTPAANYNGTDVFTYQLCDADADCTTATVTITITTVDDLPVAADDSFGTAEDTPLGGTVAGNDTPSGDGGNVWSLVTQALHGTAVVNTNGTFTYTPAANYNGTDTFTYRLCDTDSDCDEATVTITITAVDDTPSSANDTNTTTEDTQVSGNVSTNDTPSGDGGNVWSLVGANGGAAHGTVTMNPDGSYTYTPAANYNGTDVFTYQLCDADADCTTATVTITITAVDDTPSATNDTNTTTEDTQVSGSVSTNDTPSGDGGNVWSLVGANGGAAHGTVTMNPDGSYTYTPAANYNGTDVFTYQLCDTDADCTTATVTITITSVDDTPSSANDTNTTAEDTQVSGNVSTNDTPSGDGGNVWSLVGANGGAAHGTVTMNPDGSYTYTPAANYNGTDVFTYQLCDADADCTTATVTITITAVDDAPVAADDSFGTAEDTPLGGTVAGNDTPSGDGGNVWSLVTQALHGIAVVNADGTYTYTPVLDYNGPDTFSYQICDIDGDCDQAVVSITVSLTDDVPVAVDDSFTTDEDIQISSTLSGNDTPSGDGGNVWSLVTQSLHGTAVVNTNGTFTYTPAANYNGTDTFTYRLCDTDSDCDEATVTITITAVDDTPSSANDTNTTTEDTQVSGNVSTNDTPSGDGGNVWSLVGANGGASHGTVTMNPDGSYTYTPAANYNGTDVFTYQLCDTDADCSTGTVTVTITSVDDTPSSANDTNTTTEDTQVSGNVSTNDTPSGDGGNVWSLVGANGGAAHGTVTMNPDGSYTYTPAANYNGTDVFTYQLCDADADCTTATVTITITAVDDTPSATNDTNTTTEDTQVSGNVSTNDTPSGDGGNVWSLVGANGGAAHGTVTMNPDGSYTYTPAANYNGTDVFTYQLCDADADCTTATVTITITAVDDTPSATNDTNTTTEDTQVSGNVSTNDTPSGDGGNVWSLVGANGGAAHGTVTMNPDGSYTYTPAANYNGTDVFTYQLCDADADCTTATVTITITAVDDTPSATNDTNTTTEDTQVSGNVSTNDTPSGDGGNVWSLVGANGGAAHGTVTMNPDGSYTYTPAANYNGTDVFTYQLCDADADCTTATVTITITAVDDTPSSANDTNTTAEDTQVSGNVSTNDTPSGDGGNVWSLVGANGGAAHGTVTMNPDGSYTYTPAANYNGTDVFTYQLCDADADCTTATVTITITTVDDLPVAADDSFGTAEDTPLGGTVAGNDTPSGDGGNVWSLVTQALHGIAVVNADGTYTYTPVLDYNGPDTFSYQICDIDGDCDQAVVSITVSLTDDVPVAVDDSFTTDEDIQISSTLSGNDTPSGDGGNVWSLVTQSLHGTAVVNTNGTFTYTPAANYNGTDTFTYRLCDTDSDCDEATVTITITAVDDTPSSANDTNTTTEDTQVSGNVSTNDTPSGDGGNVWSLVGANGGAAHGTVTMNPDGSYTYTPAANYNGTDVFTYQLCDADADCTTATVTITITTVDDLPVAADDSFGTAEDTPLGGTVAGNDIPSGDGGNVWSLVTQALHGIAVVNADGTYTYTPVLDYNGPDTFSYQICDIDGDCDQAVVSITVSLTDDVPVAVDDSFTTDEDIQISSTLSGNDTPSGDGGNVWSLVTQSLHGTAVVNTNGTFTYTPAANYNGTDTFTYRLCDTDSDCDEATVTITITAVDDTPSSANDTNTTTEDTQVSGNVSTNDTPSGDGGNVWSLVGANGGAAHGTVTMNPAGSYTYIPAANYNGTDVFTYQLCDADADCTTATVTITITTVDDLPVAADDSFGTAEDTPLGGTVAGNDTPSGDGGNVWSLVTQALHGIAVVNADGTYTYTPVLDYNGPDTFSYQICDIDGDCDQAVVSITVSLTDDVPVAVDDSFTTDEDIQISSTLSGNDTPSGDGGNVWSLVTQSLHGTAVVNTNGTFTYTPAANYNGTDTFTYRLCDTDSDCDEATVTITITAVDDTPSSANDTNTTTEDTQVSGNVSTNDTPSGDGGNVWSLVGANGGAAHGTVTMNPDGSYTYTPAANYNGTDVFTYQLCDADADCTTATVTITITAVDDAPVAADDSFGTAEDTPLGGTVAGNDTPSGDGGNVWSLVTQALHGTAVVNANGTFTYTPAANYNGTDVFTYQLCDADADCTTATVTITITAVDDTPSATNDTNTTTEDTQVSGNVSTNDTPSGDGGNVWSLVGANGGAAHGTVTMNPDGSYTYTPAANYNGTDVFTYQLCDADADCTTATVTITITAVDDTPSSTNDTNTTAEDTQVSGSVSTNDTPSGDGGNVWSLVGANGGAAHGTVTMNPDGSYTYTPAANYNGTDVFTYQLCDADADCTTATVTITITTVDDLPVAADDSFGTAEDTPIGGTVAGNDTPSGDGGNVWSLVTQALHGIAVVNADGTYTYTPVLDYNGPDTFSYQICDIDGDCDQAVVSITVSLTDDVPVAVDDSFTTDEDIQISSTLSGNDTPSGDGGNVWSLVTQSLHGTAVVNTNGTFTYTPAANYNGTDTFTYRLCDTDSDCDEATVTITITAVDDTPSSANDTNTTTEDTQVSGNVSTNDTPSGDGGNVWSLVGANGGAAHGTVTMNPDGSYTYTPAANYNGTDVFTYQLCDADADCTTATVTITITAVDDTPSSTDDTNTTAEDTQVSGSVSTNDTPSGDGGNVWSLVGANGGAAHGTVTMNPDGSYTYTPAANYNGTDVFTYQLCDTDADCSTGTVTVTIASVDDLPIASDDSFGTAEDTSLGGSVAGNDTTSGDGGNVWSLVTQAIHGVAVVNADGTYTYTPALDYNGPDSFTYQLCDIDGDCDQATVSITVNLTDDVPVANDDTFTTDEDIQVNSTLVTNDTPSGDGSNVWSLVTQALHGAAVVYSDGTYTYTPSPDYYGPDSFAYQICDSDNDCDQATVSITVNPINDPPVLSLVGNNSICQESLLAFTCIASDIDIPTQNLIFSLVNAPNGASITQSGQFTWTPDVTQSGNYIFTISVTDNGTPAISDTEDITVTVSSLPASITGSTTINVGSTSTLSNSTPGGSWSSENTAVATVNGSTGVVTGVSVGTALIRYTLGTGCSVTTTVTVQLIEYTTSFPVGWSWFSVNVNTPNMSVAAMMSACATPGDYIKDQLTSANYYAGFGWWGTLDTLNPSRMYKVRVANICGISTNGIPVDPAETPVNLTAGWNWIGFLPQTSMAINSALSSLTPAHLDYIKNQTLSALYYSGYGWYGTLSELRPEDGYMIRLTNPGTLTYPSTGLKSTYESDHVFDEEIDPAGFEYNGSVTASIYFNGKMAGNEEDLLFAYVDDKIRGVVRARYFDPSGSWLFPIMIHSNANEGEVVRFKYFDYRDQRLYDCMETVVFIKDMIIADAIKSFELNVKTGSEGLSGIGDSDLAINTYPNPFTGKLNIEYTLQSAGHVIMNVYDSDGRFIIQLVDEVLDAGFNETEWIPYGMTEGIYIIHLTVNGKHGVRKVTLIK